MANYLRSSMQETIIELYEKGWSKRRIARELAINRRTVNKYILQSMSKCTISTAGSELDNEGLTNSKCTISTTGSEGRKSLCAKHHNYIESSLKLNFSAQRIYQDLVIERGFTGSKMKLFTFYISIYGFRYKYCLEKTVRYTFTSANW